MAQTDNSGGDKQPVKIIERNEDGITLQRPVTFLRPRSSSLDSWREWLTDRATFFNVRVERLGDVLRLLGSERPPGS